MPALGESVTEGTVTRWLKNVGDQVTVDEALLEVSTDKVDTEIPSPASGTLVSIDVAVDSTVPVGAELAIIATDGAVAAPVAAPIAHAPVTPPVVNTPPVAPTPPPAPKNTPAPIIETEEKKKGFGIGTFILGAAVLIATAGAVNMMRNKN
jgi:2-oxoglutarate dehydrogenase E2 component (dihydrolipoamide succinyltransferase)